MKIEGEKNPNKQIAAEYRRIKNRKKKLRAEILKSSGSRNSLGDGDLKIAKSRDKEVRTRIRYLVREDEPVSPS